MERIVSAALAGTATRPPPSIESSAQIESVLALLPPDPERRLLLAAGVLSLYAEAGQAPDAVPPVELAPEETLQPCSREAADALGAILEPGVPPAELLMIVRMGVAHPISGLGGQHDDLMPEALELMQLRNLRLRHVLLPILLRARPLSLRHKLLPVLGERGRWLAGLNPEWEWVLEMDRLAERMGEEEPAAAPIPPDIVDRLIDPPLEPEMVCGQALDAIPCPWSEELSRAYVDVLKRILVSLAGGDAPRTPWLYAIIPGARCIAPRFIPDALALFPPPEILDPSLRRWQVALEAAREKLELRHRLIQELTQ